MNECVRQLEELQERLRDLRSYIDELDGTEFGKLEKAFDQMAKITDRAIDHADFLETNIDWEAV